MAVFDIAVPDSNDEHSQYQVGRYVSSNEVVWRIFSFAIHEHHPIEVRLAVHLENGQRVYFTTANATQIVERPPAKTLMNFLGTCASDPFATILLYLEMPIYFKWNASSK